VAATWLGARRNDRGGGWRGPDGRLRGDNPQRRIGCLGTIVTSALSVFFFVSNTALLAWWVTRSALSVPRPLLAFLPIVDWGLPVFALPLLLPSSWPPVLGMRRLATWEAS